MKTKTLEGTGRHHLNSESKAGIRRERTIAQWLLLGHLRRRRYDGNHALNEGAFNQLKAPNLRAGEGKASEFTMLVNDRLELGNRKPLRHNTALLEDIDRLADPSLAGQTLMGVSNLVAYPILYVHDLGSPEGTVVEHNPELITAQDPWPNAPFIPVY